MFSMERSEYHMSQGMDDRFWGDVGAGVLVKCVTTGRYLLGLRSQYVNEANTWGTFGGKIDADEDPKDAAMRELRGETGYAGSVRLTHISTFRSGTFRFHNFMGEVEHEFVPILSWETRAAKWFNPDELPSNLHFGMHPLLKFMREPHASSGS
jgi:8-oxo-dGTP pyrophosphatase MutT (NUDIX family)